MELMEILTSAEAARFLGIKNKNLKKMRDTHANELPFTTVVRGYKIFYHYKLSDLKTYKNKLEQEKPLLPPRRETQAFHSVKEKLRSGFIFRNGQWV
jgi:hypothetical protein